MTDTKTISDAQQYHEARNAQLKADRLARSAAAVEANLAAMKAKGAEMRAARVDRKEANIAVHNARLEQSKIDAAERKASRMQAHNDRNAEMKKAA